MIVDRLYSFTLTQEDVANLLQICDKICNDSCRIGFRKDYTPEQIELLEDIRTELVGKTEQRDVVISASIDQIKENT